MSKRVYCNKFFSKESDAKEFKKIHGGVLIKFPKRRCESLYDFRAEMQVAFDSRGEIVNPAATPYCVSWNEKVGD